MRVSYLVIVVVGGAGCDPGAARPPLEPDLPGRVECESILSLTGTLTPPGAPPTPDLGCVPQGTWSITATVDPDGECSALPALPPQFVYLIQGVGGETDIIYQGSEFADEVVSGIHAGGNGECKGSFEHIWADDDGQFHLLQLGPWNNPGELTFQGEGSYQLWDSHP